MATKLVKRGDRYSVRIVVPVKYRAIIGKSQIWKTTGTGCLTEAERRSHALKAAILRDIDEQVLQAAEAAKHTSMPPAELLQIATDLQSQIASGEISNGIDEYGEIVHAEDTVAEIFSGVLDDWLKSKGYTPGGQIDADDLRIARRATRVATTPDYEPLSVAIETYLTSKVGRINASTIDRKRSILMAFDTWAGSPAVSDVDRRMAGDYLAEVLQPAKLARKTKEWHAGTLSTAWAYFLRRGFTEVNPWAGFTEDLKESTRGSIENGNSKRRVWTPEEITKLADINHDDDMYGISMLCLYHALRTDEAASLRVKDINLTDKFLVITSGKNQASVRDCPIHSRVLPLVSKLVEGKAPDDYLFDCKPGGRDRKKSHNVSKRMGRWIREHVSTDKNLVWYGLRATAITELERAGVDPLMIQRIAGHSTGKITFDVYSAGPVLEAMREAIEHLEFKV